MLGIDSRRLGPREFAQIGYVSENQEMPEWMTVEYFLAYLQPFYPTWDDARAKELLRQFDLPLDRKLRHLSRGMRMKAALASSLAYRPKLIVLDEPFTGLDPLVRDEFIEGLLENAEETTILDFLARPGGDRELRQPYRVPGSRALAVLRRDDLAERAVPRSGGDAGSCNRRLPLNLPATWLRRGVFRVGGAIRRDAIRAERTLAEVRRVFGTFSRCP